MASTVFKHDWRLIRKASQDMNKALEEYREAKEQVKSAAADLASAWEGDAREAFVASQETAYNWYTEISDIAEGIIMSVSNAAQRYAELEAELQSITK